MQEENLHHGPWHDKEDEQLIAIVALIGEKRWDSLAKASGLKRSGKSCRLRWMNYLRPNLKHGRLSTEEERIIFQLHKQWGNKWAKIAQSLPGRTDNEIKNYWRSHLRKRTQSVLEQAALQIPSVHAGYCGSSADTTEQEQDVLVSEHDAISLTSNNNINNSDSLRRTDDPFHDYYAIASSPYETRLSDWVSSWLDKLSEVSNHGDISSLDNVRFSYPVSNSEDNVNTSLWDSSSGSLGTH